MLRCAALKQRVIGHRTEDKDEVERRKGVIRRHAQGERSDIKRPQPMEMNNQHEEQWSEMGGIRGIIMFFYVSAHAQ